ncbi:MAG: Rib/alpha-like domain-containing protein, partial [Peptoniphilaceae bacterium]|nr:Rib/alpha-like domain-containing protein [Peptoniphilaceae bacterium]
MEKYKKIRVTFEEKVFDKKRKPIYATRKLSVGLVSCMLGFMMFMPTVKAVEEETIPTSQQVQDKDEVLDKTDNHTQEEKEEVTPLIDKGASKIDGEENLSDQKLDGQNKEENTIKEENTDDDLENKDEELLTADEIQAIRDRTNSLENDYFFNDNMVEELKVELRKANADPSVNYEQAKARLIDEAIQKNTPDKQAPGEEKAAVKVKAPTIKTVSIGDKVIKGSGAPSIYVKGKRVNGRVYVSLVDSKGNEKANGFFTRKGYSGNWEVTLSVAAAEGDKVIAYSVVDNRESPRAEVEVKKTLNIINKDKLKMPTGEIWIEQTSSNQVNGDEQAEAIEMLKNANPDIAKDFKSIKFSIDGTDHAYYDVVYTDKSTSGKIEAPSLKIKTVTETSAAPTIEKVHVTDGQIIVTLDKEVAAGTKFYFIKQFTDAEDKSFCDEGKCKVDKSTSQDMTQAVSVDGKKVTFQINAADDLELGRDFGIVVKESHKFRSCTISQPVLTSPDKVAVRDPHKLTDDDKKAIDKAIRDANTINGKSKLPDGTGFVDDPAFIEFDKEGNVRIIKPNDVNGTYDNGKFIPNKKEDGSYDVKKGSSVTTFPAKDLVKNLVPEIPSVEYNETNHQIIISPDKVDTDAQQVEVTYTGTDGNEKKVLATKKEGVWSTDDDQVKVDENGIVSLPTSKVKGGTKVIAKVTDIGGLIEEEKPLTSKPGELYLTKAEKVKDIGGLDPVEIRKWVGDEVDWKEGVKAKDQSNNEEITKLLTEKGTKITDESSRTTEKEGDFEGKIKVTFDDGSSIEVEKQMLYVSNLVTSIDNKNVPTDALEVEFKLGEGTKVDNTSGGAIEGNKDNPTPYSKYNVKPGTNLKEYKLPSINTSVVDSINVTTQDTYTEPVWKDSKNGTHFIASTENKVFIATATKTYKVTLTANGGKGEDKVEVKKTGEKYKLPKGDTFNPPNENQKFSGWMIGDGPDVLDPDKEITVDGDKIIKAIWKPIEFKVTFKTEEGATGSMKDETVTKGSE